MRSKNSREFRKATREFKKATREFKKATREIYETCRATFDQAITSVKLEMSGTVPPIDNMGGYDLSNRACCDTCQRDKNVVIHFIVESILVHLHQQQNRAL